MSKVMTGKVRASFVNVFRPRTNEESGKEEYSMTLLIPKKDKETLDKLNKAMDDAIAAVWGGRVPSGVQKPLHDGDGQKPMGGDYGPECKGHYVLNVKTNRQPGIVDTKRNDVIDEREFQSGDYCRCTLNAYAYDNKRKGVSFGLNNIQILAKGEPLGSARPAAKDEFDEVETDDDDILG